MEIKIKGHANNSWELKNIKGESVPDKINKDTVKNGMWRKGLGIDLFDEIFTEQYNKWDSGEGDYPEQTENSTGIRLKFHTNMIAHGNYTTYIYFDFEELEYMLEYAKRLKKERIDKHQNDANKK